jgi:hypothetical protein
LWAFLMCSQIYEIHGNTGVLSYIGVWIIRRSI